MLLTRHSVIGSDRGRGQSTAESHFHAHNILHNYYQVLSTSTDYYQLYKNAAPTRTSLNKTYNSKHSKNNRNDHNNNNNQNENNNNKNNYQDHGHSNRTVRRQRRASKWRDSQARRLFDDQFRQFDWGSKKYKKALEPSISELINYVTREYKQTTKNQDLSHLWATAVELAECDRQASQVIQSEVEEYVNSATYGSVQIKKPDDTVRLIFENVACQFGRLESEGCVRSADCENF